MKLFAIGGGDRTPAVKKALELSGEPARALIIPSAASTEAAFVRKSSSLTSFFDDLGVENALLHQFGERPTKDKIEHELGRASLIYTFGGNTPYMIRTMAEHGTNTLLKQALEAGKVHVGLSAGALLPFSLAHSNIAAKPAETAWDYQYLTAGVNVVDAVATVHANQHDPTPEGPRPDNRLEALAHTFPAEVQRGYALDNGATAVFGEHPEIIRTDPAAEVHYLERDKDGQIIRRPANINDLT